MSEPAATASAQPTQASAFWQEIESLKTPPHKDVATAPKVGSKAPLSPSVSLDGRPTLIVFLRHCGCPFAEKIFKRLAVLSEKHKDVHCIAVSHSSAEATEKWIPQVGGAWAVDVQIDQDRDLYAQWGLGVASIWHAMGPSVLYSAFRLGKDEGVWNKPTESGSRWQTSGSFAIDKDGIVQWAHPDASANDLPDLDKALLALGIE